ncbi:class I SAM-dependent methyltransferase [Maribellus sp. CM-23]|uniref:class I SAM-dependent methyltransferase n=1 Tax=Maribellus sp. CM-23 TaxID=2781026 RepID=UPI001F1E4B62|nr:class I SAM-dependent methyltransferase [Maribellus sp. CM-23]MCE4566653.1 class I SAM-dependent methyltransferase [Maribellus sp. CM-23]
MNDLENYFKRNDKRRIFKWMHYFDIYDRHFSRFRNKEIVILEIGVAQGGSLQMWRNYFGDEAKIFGVDINPRCKELEEENIQIFIGSQSDRNFLKELKKQIPPVDILIDDGGHTMRQQIVTYEELFDVVKENGVYLCEDLHTSYWARYGGGHKRSGTFIEYSKNFIDYLNAYHSEQRSLPINNFTKSVDSIHYYDSIIVIEKRKREKPYHEKTGKISFQNEETNSTKVKNKIKNVLLLRIDRFLRCFRIKSIIRS